MFLVEKGSFIYLYREYKNERHSFTFIYLLPGLARALPSVLKVILGLDDARRFESSFAN